MNEMIERVARALHDQWLTEPETVRDQAQNGHHLKWEAKGEIGRAKWLNAARAAIEAMREPDPDQLAEGMDAYARHDDAEEDVGGIYTAMIDAALKEAP